MTATLERTDFGEQVVEVEISRESIEEGTPGSPNKCPIALELNALLRPYWFARVHATTFDVGEGVLSKFRLSLPPKAIKWIRRFDRGWWPRWFWCRPISFEVRIPRYLLHPRVRE